MRAHDLLVVGGGPAGATLAALAARQGASVLLLEKERFPREKVCGEFVAAEGCAVLRRLGLLGDLERKGAVPMDSCRLTDRRGRPLEVRLPDVPGAGRAGIGVSRGTLDASLLALAAASGVDVRQQVEARAPLLEAGQIVGVRASDVRSRSDGSCLRARLVVAADGRRSVIQRALAPGTGDPLRSGPRSWFGLAAHFGGEPWRPGRPIELHLFRGGYAGLAGIEGGRTNLCLLVRMQALRECGGSPDRTVEERIRANPAARASLRGLSRSERWRSVGPLRFGLRKPVLAGALLVGDAAGTVDPFCGEGISHAVRGAEVALPFVLEALELGRLTTDLARAYARAWRAELGPITRRARWLGALLGSGVLSTTARACLAGPGRGLLPRLALLSRTGCSRPPGRPQATGDALGS